MAAHIAVDNRAGGGLMVVTMDLPVPGKLGVPPRGPPEMAMPFSGLSHFVSPVTSFQRSQRSNPFPPVNFSLISSGMGMILKE